MPAETLKNRTVRLSDKQIQGLQTAAKATKRKYTEVIRIAVDEFLERHPAKQQRAA